MRQIPLSEYEVIPPEDFEGRYSLIKQPWYVDQNPKYAGSGLGRFRLNYPERAYTKKHWFDPDPDKYLVLFDFEHDKRYIMVGVSEHMIVQGFFGEVDVTPKRLTNGYAVRPQVFENKRLVQIAVPVGMQTVAAAKIGDRRFVSTLVCGCPSMTHYKSNPTNLWLPIPRYPVQPDLSKLGDTLL